MRYTVTWVPAAQDELARIWMNAADRNQITRAAALIDRILGSDPTRRAVPEGDEYRLVVRPLAVLFSFSPDDCLARVLEVILLG